MSTPEKTNQGRSAIGFTGLVVKDDPDAADGTLLVCLSGSGNTWLAG